MILKTSQKIVEYIRDHQHATAHELINYLSLSPRAVFKQLKYLLAMGLVQKIGKPPKVFYFLPEISSPSAQTKSITEKASISPHLLKVIEQYWLFITPTGDVKSGFDGFRYWCDRNRLPVAKTAAEYAETLKKYNAYRKEGLIDGMEKIKNTFSKVWLDQVYYLDFYSIERFGKTKLGQLLLYSKQSQNLVFIKQLILSIKPKVDKLITKLHISAVGFIPPTIKREVQFMKELRRNLHLSLPMLPISKIKTPIIVPQKALNKLQDRIENAKTTIAVEENTPFKNILLIDDAVGSGSTLNETAKQIKDKRLCTGKIIGLAITGSFKGFDVISEV